MPCDAGFALRLTLFRDHREHVPPRMVVQRANNPSPVARELRSCAAAPRKGTGVLSSCGFAEHATGTAFTSGRQRLNIAASDGQFPGKRRTLPPN
jgi:hypothetical protein